MSSSLSPRRDSSKLRWSRSKLPSPDPKQSHPEKPSSAKLSLNLFFGFKSKKTSSPVAQHPPTVLASPAPILSNSEANSIPSIRRAPSKSVSSTRSRVDSIGPKTPTDGLREARQSLLTLSDLDPFAGRGITVVTSPRSAIGHNRLSIYSNNSLPDVGKPESKVHLSSPASPSSRPLSPDSLPFSSPSSSRAGHNSPSRSVFKKRSVDFSRKGTIPPSSSSSSVAIEEELPKSSSTLTLTDKERFISALPARTTRARGMTESAMSFVNYRGTMQTSVATIRPSRSRQLSISRLGSPPSAPPNHGLPPPPISNADASGDEDNSALTESASSSCLSFASVSSDVFLTYYPRNKEKAPNKGAKDSPSSAALTPVRGPKRATSHNSLVKPDALHSAGEEEDKGKDPEEKSPRKQRSFHHPKLPTLPMLSRSANTLPMPSSPTGSSPIIEQRRGSNSSLPSRRRLFSGSSRRPSTSQGIVVDDDAQSIFSLQSEQNTSSTTYRSWARPSSCSPMVGDERENDEPSSPQLENKYTPQHIMSPAEMAQVEASVDVVSSPRTRGLSISTITSQRENKEESSTSTTSPALRLSPLSKSSTFPSRKSSFMFSSEYSHALPPMRPKTSQANLGPSLNEHTPYRPSSSPPLPLLSLPPPPRPRQRTTTAPSSSKSTYVTDIDVRSSPQPPPRKTLLANVSTEKFLRRHSLLRKPSFLEIDDDGDKSDHDASPGDSFLDLTRESLDANGD